MSEAELVQGAAHLRLTRDKLMRVFLTQAQRFEDRVGEGFVQFRQQALFGLTREIGQFDFEGFGQPVQQAASNVATVGFDEIEVARRYARLFGEARLGETLDLTLISNPEANRRAHDGLHFSAAGSRIL